MENFTEKLKNLKEKFGITTNTRENTNSKFGVVKSVMKEMNTSKEEAIYKIITKIKENGTEINDEVYKQVLRLIGNFSTYVRKSYKGYEGLKLIEEENHYQVVTAEE